LDVVGYAGPTTPVECVRKTGLFSELAKTGVREFPSAIQMELFLEARNGALRKHAYRYALQQLIDSGYEFEFTDRSENVSETPFEIPKPSATDIAKLVLTNDDVEALRYLSSNELRAKRENADMGMILKDIKFRLGNKFHLCDAQDINLLSDEKLVAKMMQKGKTTNDAKAFVARHNLAFNRLENQQKLNVLRFLHGEAYEEQPDWRTDSVNGMHAELARILGDEIVKKVLCASHETEELHPRSVLYLARRVKTEAVGNAVVEWFKKRDGKIKINTSDIAKMKKARKDGTDEIKLDKDTKAFVELAESIPREAIVGAKNNDRAEVTDPVKKVLLMLRHMGAPVDLTKEQKGSARDGGRIRYTEFVIEKVWLKNTLDE